MPIGDGEVVISPLQKGIVVYSGDGDKVFQIGLGAAGEALLKMTQPIENGSCEVSISPRQIEISRLDGTGLPQFVYCRRVELCIKKMDRYSFGG